MYPAQKSDHSKLSPSRLKPASTGNIADLQKRRTFTAELPVQNNVAKENLK
jgi:hypothetical protein